jgi:hypothetical protein
MDVGQLEIMILLEKLEGITCDASSGELLKEELVQKARATEMETFKKHEVYTKVPVDECWRVAGKEPLGVKWVDVNKGDEAPGIPF